MRFIRYIVLALGLTLPLAAGTQNLPDLGESAQSEFSPQAERRMGESIMREIRRDADYVDDPEIKDYVSRVGFRLTAASPDAAGQSFEFFVVRDPTVNAFALPGGFIGVHSGLLITSQGESEFASVMAHEIAHVTQRHIARQLQAQNQMSTVSMVGMVLALLAARSNPQLAQGALVAGAAAPVAAFLSYSRDFEREADRVGFQTLQSAGFDVYGMPTFFERLQKSTRLYENNAPGYLRTHPLTTERIADMQNRTQDAPFRQRPDSAEFQFVRAKLRAQQGSPEEAVAFFRDALAEKRYTDEAAARYGYVVALMRARQVKEAATEMVALDKLAPRNAMIDTLTARVRADNGDRTGALNVLSQSLKTYPDNAAVKLAYAELLQENGRNQEAVDVLTDLSSQRPREARVYNLLAKSYSELGKQMQQHRALAEFYYLQGSLPGAIEQLQFAQSSKDGDFYSLSAVDARLRQLRAEQLQEMKDKKK